MSLKPVSYISLNALSYIEFNSLMRNKTVEYLVNNKLIKEDNLSNPELSALKNESNPLRSWKLIAQSPSSVSEVKVVNYRGYKRKEVVTRSIPFSCTAFQNPETGEIIFSFKGTDFDLSGIKGYIEADNDISSADTQIALGM